MWIVAISLEQGKKKLETKAADPRDKENIISPMSCKDIEATRSLQAAMAKMRIIFRISVLPKKRIDYPTKLTYLRKERGADPEVIVISFQVTMNPRE